MAYTDKRYRRSIFNVISIFYLNKNIEFVKTTDNKKDGFNRLTIKIEGDIYKFKYFVPRETNKKILDTKNDPGNTARNIKQTLLSLMNDIHKLKLPWGILTGVRPVKIATKLLLQGYNKKDIINQTSRKYSVSYEKASLIADLAKLDMEFFGTLKTIEDSVSLYVSIPFCPNICTYCSFASYPLKRYKNLSDEYIKCLIKELNDIKKFLIESGKYIKSIYIGGGTPAVLSERQIDSLLNCIDGMCKKTEEITFEAGRPEVFNDKKQKVVKNHNVNRICINPQSMNDEILRKIGRGHTVKDVYNCYDNAVKNGFDNINTDIIVGLPDESLKKFEKSLKNLLKLDQQSVTVHTLAIKNQSDLIGDYNAQKIVYNKDIDNLLDITEEQMKAYGFKPYYLYRQKMSVGNRENTGYSKKGYECIYNMLMIGERQTVIGAGAGAMNRIVSKEGKVKRISNKKLIDQYIKDIKNNENVKRFGEINERL